MSYFAVTIEEISSISPHSNADRLAIASLKGIGFKFIVGKDTWKEGDKCLYFPLDAVLPDPLLKALGVEGKLAGAKRNRIKTIKLRGEISQGLVGPLSLIDELPEDKRTPEEITNFLGVTKYEPEINLPCARDARLIDLPEGVGIYDIENCERFPEATNYLMDQKVYITEKMEGSHFALAWVDNKMWVCQRRFALEPISDMPKHFFWEVTENMGLDSFLKELVNEFGAKHLVIRGEILGPNIQSNIYYLPERVVRFFDLMVDQRYVDAEVLINTFKKFNREDILVPAISINKTLREWLDGKSLVEASTGNSSLKDILREGIVIRPMKEQSHPEIGGRLILKQISPEYLAA